MQIKIPLRVVRWADAFGDWLNIILFSVRQFDIRIVDAIVGTVATISTVWWYLDYGWWGALESVLLFVLGAMISAWFL
jgi:hypothetical protein